jgi:hypothetical protein
MNAASDTTNAINQGFARGVHADSGLATLAAALTTFLKPSLINVITKRYFSFYCNVVTGRWNLVHSAGVL